MVAVVVMVVVVVVVVVLSLSWMSLLLLSSAEVVVVIVRFVVVVWLCGVIMFASHCDIMIKYLFIINYIAYPSRFFDPSNPPLTLYLTPG